MLGRLLVVNIQISSNLVQVLRHLIEQVSNFDPDALVSINPVSNAITQNNLISLANHLSSMKKMGSEFTYFKEDDLEELFCDAPLIKFMIIQIRDMPSNPNSSDIKNILSNIKNELVSLYPITASENDIHAFLTSVVRFYLLDEPINFNHLLKNELLSNEIKQSRWLLENVNPYVKQLFLSKVANNSISLDIDIFYSLAASFPLYIKETETSLNFRHMESEFNIYSDSFENDLNKIKSIQASNNAKIKAEKYKQDNKQAFQNIEEMWDTGKWTNATKCAEDIFNINGIDLPFSTVYKHLRSYMKSKK